MTEHYVGTKIVMDWAQAHADGREGYTVKYSDGYTSWCPKAQFEESNVAIGHVGHMPPHQQRVIAEREQLADRIQKLEAFLHTDLYAGLPEDEQQLLKMQADAMVLYLGIINTRTSKFV
ncbi:MULTISPECIES: hypothetical protein [Pseudomonas]|uniref:Uncharacterized protein n=1 Tax=Pseudomonas cedrina TaxID=651740 RepID=A0A2S9E2E6_PSECE|nr:MULTISPECIES: hypothetical protein [Pseudomonas]AVJ20994.1 hypothetical protein CLM72_04280 [Pseudomonas sp. MYb193]PRC09009.1 hypothetical protein CQ006_04675 [Pseudomonas cedrina]